MLFVKHSIPKESSFHNPAVWAFLIFVFFFKEFYQILRSPEQLVGALTDYDRAIIDIYDSTFTLVATVVFFTVILNAFTKAKYATWTTSESDSSLNLFLYYIIAKGVDWIGYEWGGNNGQAADILQLFEIDAYPIQYISYWPIGIITHAIMFLVSVKLLKHGLHAVNCTASKHFQRVKKAPSSEQNTPISIQNNLQNAIDQNKSSERLMLVLIILTIIACAGVFTYYLDTSTKGRIRIAANNISDNQDLKNILSQKNYDERLGIANIEAKNILALINAQISVQAPSTDKRILSFSDKYQQQTSAQQEHTVSTQTLIDIKQYATNIISNSNTITKGNSQKSYEEILVRIEKQYNELIRQVNSLTNIDIESVLFKIAITSLAIFIIQILFSTFKFIRKERSRLQDQVLAIQVLEKHNSKDKSEIFAQLLKEINSTELSFEKTPRNIINKLMDTISKMTRNSAS